MAELCAVCGGRDQPTEQRLVRWLVPPEQGPFALVARCTDAMACGRRVKQSGRLWPLFEHQPPRTAEAQHPQWEGVEHD